MSAREHPIVSGEGGVTSVCSTHPRRSSNENPPLGGKAKNPSYILYLCILPVYLGFPPDADGNGNYAFFDAANYALIQMTGGVTAISAV